MLRNSSPKFLVAFSFAGEERDLVRSIAESVKKRLGHGAVFFDEWYEDQIAGYDADLELQRIYREDSVLVIPCLSQAYADKPWTRDEQDAIRDFRRRIRQSPNPTEKKRLLPIRVGDGDVEGMKFDSTIDLDVRERTPDETAQLIVNRLRATGRVVYLAECIADREFQRQFKRLKDHLADLGWYAITSSYETTKDAYLNTLEQDMRDSLAFIQILSDMPWKPLPLDLSQFQAAQNHFSQTSQDRIFQYRDSSLEWAHIEDEAHRQFSQEARAIEGSFEDFKSHLAEKLEQLWQQKEQPQLETSVAETVRPFVQVVIRANNPDSIWEHVQGMLEDEALDYGEFESIRETQSHGFLVVCDEGATEDQALSPREDLFKCREFQMKQETGADQIPPVGILYWPPPAEPKWAKLLRCRPARLSKIVGADDSVSLSKFFNDVQTIAGKGE